MSFVEWLESSSAYFVAVVMVGICAAITLQNVVMHLVNYSRDDLQRHVIRIVLVIPIYCTASWLEIAYPNSATICHAIVDFWEALVIYSFFNLILEYVGGEHNWLLCVQQSHPEGLQHLQPFSWCFPKRMDLNPSWLRACKVACFQFVFIKPFFGLLMLPVLFTGNYYVAPWPLIRDIVYNITYTIAMYALALLYLTTHSHPSLKPKRPLAKFTSVKIVIFFTYWQRYLLVFFDLTDAQMSATLSFLTMVEMTLCAIPINWVAFPWREFQTGLLDSAEVLAQTSALELVENGNASPSDKMRNGVNRFNRVVNNAMKVFSPNDMVETANQNFTSKYKTHVLLESSQEYVIEDNPTAAAAASPDKKKKKRTFRARTYLIGGLTDDSSPKSSIDLSPVSEGGEVIGAPRSDLHETPPASPSPTRGAAASVVVPLLPMPARHRVPTSPPLTMHAPNPTHQFVRMRDEFDDEAKE